MIYQIVFSREAEEDLEIPLRAIQAIRGACQFLAISPFSCRKAGDSPFVRELIVPFGASGFVVLFEIKAAGRVHIGAVRHQRESDYH